MPDIPQGWSAIIAAIIGVGGTGLAALLAWLVRINMRSSQLLARIEQLERRDRLSWLYIRSLIDHAYRHNAVPLPDPPEGWNDQA